MRALSGSITGAGRSQTICERAVGLLDLDPDRVGPGRGQHDVLGTDQALDPLVLELGVDLLAVGLGVAVDLVEDEDDRLLVRAQLGEGLDLPALHVAGDDEEDQVGVPGDVAGQGLADLAADLVDARRVDEDEPGLVEAAGPLARLLPPLGRAGDRRAVRGADLEDVAAQQRIEDRRLAPADHAEGGDLDGGLVELLASARGAGGSRSASDLLFLGGELEARERRLQAVAGALDGVARRRTGLNRGLLELLEDRIELQSR